MGTLVTRGGDDDDDHRPATSSQLHDRLAGAARGKRPSFPSRIALYNRQVVSELRKVIWPTRNELVTYTIVSVTFVAFMIAFVGVLDYLFTKARLPRVRLTLTSPTLTHPDPELTPIPRKFPHCDRVSARPRRRCRV